MRQQHISRKPPETKPVIIDERQPSIPDIELQHVDSDLPVRSVFYVEVGDTDPSRVQLLIEELNKVHAGNRGGIHYIIPIRFGKIGTDIVFESAFLDIVNEVCEIVDGQIKLKNGAQDVYIIRTKIE